MSEAAQSPTRVTLHVLFYLKGNLNILDTYESSLSRKWYFSGLKMRHTNLIESNKNDAFHCIWSISWAFHEGKIWKLYFKRFCITLVQKLLIHFPSHYKRAKTGLRPRFYLNCSHMLRTDPLAGIHNGGKRKYWVRVIWHVESWFEAGCYKAGPDFDAANLFLLWTTQS